MPEYFIRAETSECLIFLTIPAHSLVNALSHLIPDETVTVWGIECL